MDSVRAWTKEALATAGVVIQPWKDGILHAGHDVLQGRHRLVLYLYALTLHTHRSLCGQQRPRQLLRSWSLNWLLPALGSLLGLGTWLPCLRLDELAQGAKQLACRVHGYLISCLGGCPACRPAPARRAQGREAKCRAQGASQEQGKVSSATTGEATAAVSADRIKSDACVRC